MRHSYHLCIALIAVMLTACGPQQDNAWQDLDYSSVYRRAKLRELDLLYTPPTDIGCLEDDLYNCSR